MFIIGKCFVVKASCVLANMLLNKLLFVIGMLLQSLSSQVTIICIALSTMQIVSKQLYISLI